MRDSLLRLIDDLQTKKKAARFQAKTSDSISYYLGVENGLKYAIKEIKKVLDDHANTNRV